MNDKRSAGWSRRRLLGFASLATALGALAAVGHEWPPSRVRGARNAESDAGTVHLTLVSFIGALFGRVPSQLDAADLAERVAYLLGFNEAVGGDCRALAVHLDHLAAQQGSSAFNQCEPATQASIVDQVMRIDVNSIAARLLTRLSASHRAYYRMRWAAVPQLAWLYRHSPAAWRARGYSRWAGVAGDWREVLRPGSAYP